MVRGIEFSIPLYGYPGKGFTSAQRRVMLLCVMTAEAQKDGLANRKTTCPFSSLPEGSSVPNRSLLCKQPGRVHASIHRPGPQSAGAGKAAGIALARDGQVQRGSVSG